VSEQASERWSDRLDARLSELPAWAHPPIYGMLFVYLLMFVRLTLFGGALAVVLIVGVIRGGFGVLLQVAWAIVSPGLAGFVGGVGYALLRPPGRLLGRFGAFPAWWVGVAAYVATAFFLLSAGSSPLLEDPLDLRARDDQIILAIASLIFGSVCAAIEVDIIRGMTERARPRRRWVKRKQRVTSRVHPPAG
jgi:hypothetical protein